MAANKGMKHYDIRAQGEYDVTAMLTLLNNQTVRQQLGIPERAGRFAYITQRVFQAFHHDQMHAEDAVVAGLLEEDIRVLVYAGDKDLKCNWLGNRRWVDALEWSGRSAWTAAKEYTWGPQD